MGSRAKVWNRRNLIQLVWGAEFLTLFTFQDQYLSFDGKTSQYYEASG